MLTLCLIHLRKRFTLEIVSVCPLSYTLLSELKMTLYKRESLGFLLVLIEMGHYFLKTISLKRVKLKSIKVVNLSYKPRGKMF